MTAYRAAGGECEHGTRNGDRLLCAHGASTLKRQSNALRRQPLLQLRPKQNFISEALSKTGVPAFQSGIHSDGQASELW